MSQLNKRTWGAIRGAVNAALAGGSGGDFTEEAIHDLEDADRWLCKIGEQRGYFRDPVCDHCGGMDCGGDCVYEEPE